MAKDNQRKLSAMSKRKSERELNDLKRVLALPEGRRLIWRILSETKFFCSTFQQDPNFHAYIAGKRDIGVFLFAEISRLGPKVFEQMQNEHKNLAIIEQRQQEELKNDNRDYYYTDNDTDWE